MSEVNKELIERELIGKKPIARDGIKFLEDHKIFYRIVAVNGHGRAMTCDYRSNRCNIEIMGAKEIRTTEPIPEDLRKYYNMATTRELVECDSEVNEAYISKISWG